MDKHGLLVVLLFMFMIGLVRSNALNSRKLVTTTDPNGSSNANQDSVLSSPPPDEKKHNPSPVTKPKDAPKTNPSDDESKGMNDANTKTSSENSSDKTQDKGKSHDEKEKVENDNQMQLKTFASKHCKGNPFCSDQEKTMIACIQDIENGTNKLTLLVRNERDKPLKVNVTLGTSINTYLPAFEIPGHGTDKVNFTFSGDKSTKVILNAGNGDCELRIDASKSKNTDDTLKPKDVNNPVDTPVKPKDKDDPAKLKDADDLAKSNEAVDPQKPKNADDAAKAKDADAAVRVKDADAATRAKDADDAARAKQAEDATKAKDAEDAAKGKAKDNDDAAKVKDADDNAAKGKAKDEDDAAKVKDADDDAAKVKDADDDATKGKAKDGDDNATKAKDADDAAKIKDADDDAAKGKVKDADDDAAKSEGVDAPPDIIGVETPISQNNLLDQLSFYSKQVTPIYGAYFAFLVALVIGGSWAMCSFRKRRTNGGVPYQELEMGLPESSNAIDVETAEGWDQDWDDDDWDEDKAIRSPGARTISSNGLTSRATKKDGWDADWEN